MTKLFNNFPPASKAEWLAKVEKDLKGKSIEGLNWQLNEQLTISPFAHAEDLAKQFAPLNKQRSTNFWEIGVKVQVANMQLANQEALNALSNGANAISFELSKSPSKTELKTLLKNIQLEWISTHFTFKQKSWKRFMSFFVDYIADQQFDTNKIACTFSFKGKVVSNQKDAEKLQQTVKQLPKAQLLTVNAQVLARTNDFVIEETAQILQQGNEVLTALQTNNLSIADFNQQIQFSIALGDSYFLNIAKIRAIKLLWQQVLTAWDSEIIAPTNIEVHLTTNTQTDNENYNKIKASAQAMAAVIAGATRLYIYPSDEFKDGVGTPFAQRIALNIQHLMQLESYMNRVIDPAAGSYYIENLTNELAEAAWKRFQEIAD